MRARGRAGEDARRGHRRRRSRTGAAALAAALALFAGALAESPRPVARAQALQRYSGHVVDVDLIRGRLVVEELGRRGLPVRREVEIEQETPLVSTSRMRPGDMRGASAYAEIPVSLADVVVGDFVVVEAVDLDGRWLARRITIVETRRR